MIKSLLLRHETKPFEERSPLTPDQAKILIEDGHTLYVEKSSSRIFKDIEFQNAGCHLVEAGSWKSFPKETVILGLKELEDEEFDLVHRHIYFAHLYKGQEGAQQTLERFKKGDGKLYDLEYLVDENKKRVAAFGVWAGFVGAALGIELWCRQQLGETSNDWRQVQTYQNEEDLINSQKEWLKQVKTPKVIVIGAKGRCGKGAKQLLNKLNIPATLFGRHETKSENLQSEILKHDILINTVLMTKKTKPFLTEKDLNLERNLTVLSDISCDPTGEFNPLPFYKQCTTMDQPAITLDLKKRFDITAIDHLPSLLPRESSQDFADQLFPHLKTFLQGRISNTPWERSLELFYKNIFEIENSLIVKEIYQ